MQYNNDSTDKRNDMSDQSVSRSVRPSIFAELEKVKEQVNFDSLVNVYKTPAGSGQIYEICLIIAEVFVMPPDSEIKISGSEISVFIIQEVFSKLTLFNVSTVVENFKHVKTKIYNKKAYLRTALYNSVFEDRSSAVNAFASEIPDFYG
jgi:hypothetical protein